jgi:tetratricopeptide (TPR) repeat protein
MGEMQQALSMAEELLALNKRTKNTVGAAQTIVGLGWGYWILGEWDKSLQYLMEGRDLTKKTGEYQDYGWATLTLGELFMEMGDYTEAETYFSEANRINEKAGDTDRQFAEVFPALSRLYLKKGEIEKAKELVAKTDEYVTKTKSILNISYAEMLKAMLFREQKNWEQSVQHFEKSLQGYKSLNSQK